MRIIRLAATGTACGAAALTLLAPTVPARAQAAPAAPKATTTFPEGFRPGYNLVIEVTGCEQAPTSRGLRNEIFAEDPGFQKAEDGDGWTAIGGTRRDLQAGRTYRTEFRCGGLGGETFPLQITVPGSAGGGPGGGATGSPSPGGGFEFGFDKVKLSTRKVVAGGTMGFTVTCPTTVTAESAAFAEAPEFTRKGQVSKGTATFAQTLPSIVKIKVTCAGHGHVEYSTEPAEEALGEGGPKIPVGAPNTGGGVAERGPGAVAYGGAAAVLLAAAGTGVLTLRRRRAAGSVEKD
ncbi:hypothetical protein [Thermomonospora cellulosilytica]|uniref:Uncharacterized protein n=1 Tax=Thermomonospora cellulosilytica TaxID=1411118 RepID=A0A7W3R9A7_9ACTN|nr:hypothetical protein [Thermomonospora cellulosilytica]MBA9004606.1 hypothetical protein [Thermomonospora cellulosilytica]